MAKTQFRIKYEEAIKIVQEIKKILFPLSIPFEIYGSFIRKEPDIGDLDMLAYEKDCEKIRNALAEKSYYDRIELYCIPDEYQNSWETFALYLTGSGAFNIWMRSIARAKGYLLNQYGLYEKESNKLVSTTEKEIFELLGIDFIDPEIRSERFRSQWRKFLKNR